MVDSRRVRQRNDVPIQHGPVVYWMQRDQRVHDNWALLYAQELAAEHSVPLYVVFNLVPRFGDTTLRHYSFMFEGLREVAGELRELNIPFYVLRGQAEDTILAFTLTHEVGHVVTDFNPLNFTDAWRTKVAQVLPVRLTEVDAHNVVPAWVASPKLEFAAYTLRPKIHRLLPEFLTSFPTILPQSGTVVHPPMTDWDALFCDVVTDRSVPAVDWIIPGATAAAKSLAMFLEERLPEYANKRNDPTLNFLSHVSPYLHFGQLSAHRVALAVRGAEVSKQSRDAYLEELIVRRELADNFCLYTPRYDSVLGAHAWAQKTIAEHAGDTREHIYTRAQFESGVTHDELWNAAQIEMVKRGKMHGFMRMYWAKKILEWTPDAQTAIDTALYLNDKYSLDGSDPNGITGVMWSICGVHDRAWNERPVFGKIRYMNYNGCKRKFDVAAYIKTYQHTQPALI